MSHKYMTASAAKGQTAVSVNEGSITGKLQINRSTEMIPVSELVLPLQTK